MAVETFGGLNEVRPWGGMARSAHAALALSLWLMPALSGLAAQPAVQVEISRLIDILGSSDCRFERNGKWYGGADAKAHLLRKYDWLRKRDLAATPEQFIARAASSSSVSGRPYHVQCPGGPAQASADWFEQQLQRLRATPE